MNNTGEYVLNPLSKQADKRNFFLFSFQYMTYYFNPSTEIFPLIVLNGSLFTLILVLHISLVSSLLCSLLSFWFSHFSPIHFLPLSLLHFFWSHAPPYFINSPQNLTFLSYIIFYCLISANIHYFLKTFLAMWLIKLPPLNPLAD